MGADPEPEVEPMTSSRPGWTRLALLAAVTVSWPATLGTPAATAASHRGSAESSAAQSAVATEMAQLHRQSADRLLARRERHLARCLQRHPNRCETIRASVIRAERRLAIAESRLADIRTAPVLTLTGQTLSWAPIEGVQAYVVKSKTPGHPAQRTIVIGTSFTPPPVEGETVEYLVRPAARDSEWSGAVSISYPPATSPSGETGSGAGSGSVPGGGSGSGSGSETGPAPVSVRFRRGGRIAELTSPQTRGTAGPASAGARRRFTPRGLGSWRR